MRDDQIWHESTGLVLVLGQKIKVTDRSPYWRDYEGIDLFITGLHFEKCGKKVSITLGENVCVRESDGWSIHDLSPCI